MPLAALEANATLGSAYRTAALATGPPMRPLKAPPTTAQRKPDQEKLPEVAAFPRYQALATKPPNAAPGGPKDPDTALISCELSSLIALSPFSQYK